MRIQFLPTFLTKETNPYPFGFEVVISLTTLQSDMSPKGANAECKVSLSISGPCSKVIILDSKENIMEILRRLPNLQQIYESGWMYLLFDLLSDLMRKPSLL